MISYIKDPSAILDYSFDWSQWLEANETITSHVITVPTGLTLTKSELSAGRVVCWLSGGSNSTCYPVSCRITTNQGRTDERTLYIEVQDR